MRKQSKRLRVKRFYSSSTVVGLILRAGGVLGALKSRGARAHFTYHDESTCIGNPTRGYEFW